MPDEIELTETEKRDAADVAPIPGCFDRDPGYEEWIDDVRRNELDAE